MTDKDVKAAEKDAWLFGVEMADAPGKSLAEIRAVADPGQTAWLAEDGRKPRRAGSDRETEAW